MYKLQFFYIYVVYTAMTLWCDRLIACRRDVQWMSRRRNVVLEWSTTMTTSVSVVVLVDNLFYVTSLHVQSLTTSLAFVYQSHRQVGTQAAE